MLSKSALFLSLLLSIGCSESLSSNVVHSDVTEPADEMTDDCAQVAKDIVSAVFAVDHLNEIVFSPPFIDVSPENTDGIYQVQISSVLEEGDFPAHWDYEVELQMSSCTLKGMRFLGVFH